MQRCIIFKLRPLLRRIPRAPMFLAQRAVTVPTGTMLSRCGEGKLTPKLKQLMKKFQKDDGQPVYLKGGAADLWLYRLTLLLSVIGVVLNLLFYLGYLLA